MGLSDLPTLAEAFRLRERADAMEAALAYLADRESWRGDPASHEATLLGHDTPWELASRALTTSGGRAADAEPGPITGRNRGSAAGAGTSPASAPVPSAPDRRGADTTDDEGTERWRP